LPFEQQRQGLLREDVAQGDDEVFELGQFGTPGWTLRTPQLVGKVFGDAFEVTAVFFHLRGR
jgi:hypothetical protein